MIIALSDLNDEGLLKARRAAAEQLTIADDLNMTAMLTQAARQFAALDMEARFRQLDVGNG